MFDNWIKRGLLIFVLVFAFVAGLLATQHANAEPYDYDLFIPQYITVGPNSTYFVITDKSAGGKPIIYYCAFLSPRDTHRNTGGIRPREIYVPAVQCNK